ncbi:MAG: protease HtpX [Limnobacter sp.]|jgi:heat shock protein HtpX|uniref:Protease HtpX homolog n=1 Tax=Limnobacter profundi TaxID=2732163 RepID=A0ABX6N3V2_9BURK|nr:MULTISPECIES: protease HtpX [unclassified Limnobacter]MBA4314246.1 protease HtpX [Alcaligenaceae bacterium]PZO22900.1 MAG: protease HtpX [Betaproteobacteria bacterium]MDZ4051214.1 protease HtpX [Limnobacter sp.]PQJ24587.1 zinc metalloprotease HtpX [Limnobacter sp. SAORIC-690]QJR28434.1 protease HtpX [Limnobacter sp. SAORIC-580]
MKRIVLFLATNVAIMVVLGITVHVLGLNQFMAGGQLNLTMLLAFSAVLGFGGSFISLLISKKVAKWSTGAQVIETPRNATEQWLVSTVQRFADKAGIPMPEVAIYEGAPNAFATGPSKSNSLVAVSTGLLQSMSREEAEAVLAHEVAHIANGDMVTLTLIQGVVNTFVFFLARVVGFLVDQFLRKDDSESSGQGMGYFITVIVMEITLGILASIIVMYFSRQREFRADSGAAWLMGNKQPMISALKRLGGMQAGELPSNMAASGISGKGGVMALFSSHPPIEQRIEALAQQR